MVAVTRQAVRDLSRPSGAGAHRMMMQKVALRTPPALPGGSPGGSRRSVATRPAVSRPQQDTTDGSVRHAVSELRAALWVFHDVIVPSWLQHRLRTALTLVGVVIGVQVVVAVALVNRSTMASFEYTAETIAGSADLQIASGTVGVPEDLIAAVAARPAVASAAGLVQGTLRTDWGPLTLFGADLLGDQRIRQTQFPKRHIKIPDELRFLNAPDSVALSTSFAERAGLALGSAFEAVGPTGRVTLTVRGFLDPVGPAALFGGAVALADLPTAQRLCVLGNRVDQIDITVAEGAQVESVQADLAALVQGIGTVGPPRDRAVRFGSMLAGVQTVLTLLGVFSIVVGAFIIYHTMQTAIVQRRRDLALSRAVGFSAATVVGAVILEAVAFGAIGAIVGVLLGAAGAQLSLDVVASGIGAIWARIDHPKLALTLRDVGLGCALGIGMSRCCHRGPLARDPPHARPRALTRSVRGRRFGFGTKGHGRRRPACWWRTGACLSRSASRGLQHSDRVHHGKRRALGVRVCLSRAGHHATDPADARPHRAAPPRGELRARDGDISRVACVAAGGATPAVMLAFAMVLIVAAFITSLRGSLLTWVEQTLAADLVVLPSSQLPLPASPTLPSGLERCSHQGLPASRRSARRARSTCRSAMRSPSSERSHVAVFVVTRTPSWSPTASSWLERFDRGEAVLISDNLAYRHRFHAGERISFDTPSGRVAFVIAAVVADFTLDVGAVVVESEHVQTGVAGRSRECPQRMARAGRRP